MRISRIEVESDHGEARTFALDQPVTTIDESPADTELLMSVFRNFYLGIKRGCRLFATIDGIEFEITDDMVPLIGQRLAGQFRVLDLALPPLMTAEPIDTRDLQAVVARAALETLGVMTPTLDLERLDHALLTVDRSLEPFASAAHAKHLKRAGLLQLFSRRSGRQLLNRDDPVVAQLTDFDRVLTDRRRQVATSEPPLIDEVDRSTDTLRELASARMGGVPPETAATMTTDAVENEVASWVAQQHDRQVTPVVAELLAKHAEGIEVVGSVPAVLDLRRVHGLPPGGDALRWAAREYGNQLQVIVLVGSQESLRWIDSTVAPAAP